MSIYLPQRLRQQPQALVQVDYGNPITNGLVHAWGINTGSNQLRDFAGNANGVFGLDTNNNTGNSWVRTDQGQAINFDLTGRTSLSATTITVGNSSGSGSPNSQAFTVSFRARFNQSTFGTQLIYGGLVTNALNIMFANDGGLGLIAYPSTFVRYLSTGVFTLGQWGTATVSSDGTTAKIYKNGILISSGAVSTTFVLNTQFYIDSVSKSQISSLLVWNRALSDAEVFSVSENPHQVYRAQKQVLSSFIPSLANSLSEPQPDSANYIQAMQSGAVAEIDLQPIEKPAANTNLELGIKTQLLDNAKLQVELLEVPRETWVARLPQRKYMQQPQGKVEIDWSNPLARGLVAAFDLRTVRDLVTQTGSSLDTASTVVNRQGVGKTFPGTTTTQFSHRSNYALTGPMTAFVLVDINTLTNYTHFICKEQGATTNVAYEFRCGVNSSTGSELVVVEGTAGSQYAVWNSPAGTVFDGFSGSVAFTRDSNIINFGTRNFFANGKKYSGNLNFSSGSTNIGDDGASAVRFGSRPGDGTRLDGRVYLANLWNRALSDSEIAALSENPYQIFKPQQKRIYSLPGKTDPKLLQVGKFLPQRWRQQPQGAVQIDWSNPLARGLVCAVSDSFEAVNGKQLAFDSRISRTANYQGIGWYKQTELTTWPALTSDTNTKIPAGSNLTIATICQSDLSVNGISGTRYLASFGNDFRLYWVPSSSALAFMLRDSGGTAVYAVDYNAIEALMKVPNTVIGSWDGSKIKLYRNANLVGEGNLTSISTAVNSNVEIGTNQGYFSWHWLGWIPGLFAWKRQLSDSEIKSWHENPWQLFKPRKQITYTYGETKQAQPLQVGTFLPQRWRQQPQGAVTVDWSNPLSRGLICAWSAAIPTRNAATNLSINDVNSGAFSYVKSRRGIVYRSESVGATSPVILLPTANVPTGEMSITLHYRKTDAVVRQSSGWGTADNISDRFHAHMPWDDGTLYFDYGGYTGNNRIQASGLNYSDDIWTFQSTISGLRAWQNGKLITQNFAGLVTRTAGTNPLRLLSGSGLTDLAESSFVFIHNRGLIDSEIAQLSENPWQLFKPQQKHLYSFPTLAENTLKSADITQPTQDRVIVTPQEYNQTRWWPLNPRVRLTSK